MNNLLKFEKLIKVKFRNQNLLTQALTHKSANQKINNEKLEFLGDRVIGLILSKKLLDLYPSESEGILDKKFAKLVNKKTCRDVAWSLNMQHWIITGNNKKTININDEKILSDSCEALIGSVYIDQGFQYVEKFVLRIWKKQLEKSNIIILDPKTKLQEYSLKKFKKLPIYKLISADGPKHNPIYKISVTIMGSKKFVGIGNSKQQAETDGASKLLTSKNIL